MYLIVLLVLSFQIACRYENLRDVGVSVSGVDVSLET